MKISEVIRQRRTELGLSQAELADRIGVDKRQVRRYEAGQTHPTLPVAQAIARELGVSLDELAGSSDTRRVNLSGNWWACWQTWKDGAEFATPHQVSLSQRGDVVDVVATTRGTPVDDGGYMWRGEMKIWDNEVAIGWYVSTEGAIRSKGTMFFYLHQHGISMIGRWVGLSYDGPIISGWAAMAQTEAEVDRLINELRQNEDGLVTNK